MIKPDLLPPTTLIMAVLAQFTLLTAMCIIVFVTAITFDAGFFLVGILFMAGGTGRLFVFAL